ncbi:hypothetical protein BKA01_004772 [Pseudonocardia eucalypti]|uniref:hypothetical protein n=1 Tax=Pseudonocardia eucalypti TaxID=648755 RepID=UPI001609EFAB|nr:hypothetical protein [Pseudonocardia eucalypti]
MKALLAMLRWRRWAGSSAISSIPSSLIWRIRSGPGPSLFEKVPGDCITWAMSA